MTDLGLFDPQTALEAAANEVARQLCRIAAALEASPAALRADLAASGPVCGPDCPASPERRVVARFHARDMRQEVR